MKAALGRSIQLAARRVPLVQKIKLQDTGADFNELCDYVARNGSQL
ncbi:MAG: hypothetical protein M1370_10100 [Bacteroidetes bacterium]|nr:hypothetical protein [Bacteroidota bacterium]MCL5024987.1 hypothetical protein [Chloroflexota bacterium]